MGVLLLGVGFLLFTGVSTLDTLRSAIVVGIQAFAGVFLWRTLRRSAGVVETTGMGLALGTSMAVVSGLLVQLLLGQRWGWLLPAAIAMTVYVTGVVRRRGSPVRAAIQRTPLDRATFLGLVAAAIVGLGTVLPNVWNYPLTWTGMWGRYHPDMLFFESLSTSLAKLGPLDSIFSPDAAVRYHWLVYAWAGQVAQAADTGPFVVLTRVLPFVAVSGAVLVGIAWARRLSTVLWVPTLAVALLITGGYVGATYGAIFNFDSPSQSLTTLWLLALTFAISIHLSETMSDRWSRLTLATTAVIGLLAFVVAGGKISSGAVAAAAVLWLAFIGIVRRAAWRGRVLTIAAVVVVAVIVGYLLVVSGSADPGGLKLGNLVNRASSIQGMNPIAGRIGIVLGTLLLALAISARWAGLLWFLGNKERRWEPVTQLGVGLALAGVGTVLLVSGGMNDTWFALAASAPLAVISAAGAGDAWQRFAAHRWAVLFCCVGAAVVFFVVIALIWGTGSSGGNIWVSTWRWAGPLVGVVGAALIGLLVARRFGGESRQTWFAATVIILVLIAAFGRLLGVGTGLVGVQPGFNADAFGPMVSFTSAKDNTAVREWSSDQQDAANLLRESAAAEDLIATNVTFSPFVPALTGLPTFVSGIMYQAPYGRPAGVPVLLERERQSWAFIDQPNAESAGPLCEAGVSFIWVDPTRTQTRSWAPFAEEIFTRPSVTVLRVNETACSALNSGRP